MYQPVFAYEIDPETRQGRLTTTSPSGDTGTTTLTVSQSAMTLILLMALVAEIRDMAKSNEEVA